MNKETKPKRFIKVDEVKYRKFYRREKQIVKVKALINEAWKILSRIG